LGKTKYATFPKKENEKKGSFLVHHRRGYTTETPSSYQRRGRKKSSRQFLHANEDERGFQNRRRRGLRPLGKRTTQFSFLRERRKKTRLKKGKKPTEGTENGRGGIQHLDSEQIKGRSDCGKKIKKIVEKKEKGTRPSLSKRKLRSSLWARGKEDGDAEETADERKGGRAQRGGPFSF